MKLSAHFTSKEFACQCGCGFDTINPELVEVLEDLRAFFGQPIKINSGCRCPTQNTLVGGEKDSQHLLGNAADIVVKNTLPEKVYTYLDNKYKDKYGIGIYQNRVHIDVRQKKARWAKI